MENMVRYGVIYLFVLLAGYFSAYEFNRIVEKLDSISESLEKMEISSVRTSDAISDHERRITRLEERR